MSPIHADHPQAGYYKVRKGIGWAPVAIYAPLGSEDTHICSVGFANDCEDVDPHSEWGNQGYTLWILAMNNPITYEEYEKAYESGSWDDGGIGHNEPPPDRSFSGIQEGIDNVLFLSNVILTVENQDRANLAANLRDRLNGFHKMAEEMRVLEKDPFWQGGKKVDAKWAPLLTTAKEEADRLRDLVGPYLAKVEKEKLLAGEVDDKPRAGGAHGKRMALRTDIQFEIVDFVAALNSFHNAKELREVVEKLVARAVKAGLEVPGVKTWKARVAV